MASSLLVFKNGENTVHILIHLDLVVAAVGDIESLVHSNYTSPVI